MALDVRRRRPPAADLDDTYRLEVGRVRGFTERHPWLPTAALAVVQALLALIRVLEAAFSDARATLLGPAILLAVVLVTAVLLRRRWPVGATIAVALFVPALRWVVTGDLQDLPFSVTPEAPDELLRLPATAGFTAWVLLGTAAAHRRPRIAWPLLAFYLATMVGAVLLWVPRADVGFPLTFETTLAIIAVLAGTNMRIRRQRIAVLEDRARQLALERDQREQIAVASERNRIAREMHDVVAHSLSVMITLAEGAQVMLEKNPEQARRALTELAETGRSSLADARRLVGVLREGGSPSDTDPASGAPMAPQPTDRDIAVLVERFRGAGLPVRFTESGPPLPDDAILHLAVFRIVQESLTNVLRHAPTSPRIDVSIERTFERVVIVVDNDAGTGTPTIAGSNRGLIGIRERVAAYAGTVDAGPTPTGWRMRALLRLT